MALHVKSKVQYKILYVTNASIIDIKIRSMYEYLRSVTDSVSWLRCFNCTWAVRAEWTPLSSANIEREASGVHDASVPVVAGVRCHAGHCREECRSECVGCYWCTWVWTVTIDY